MSHPFHHLDLPPVVWPEQVAADTPTLMVDYRWGFASDKEKAQCAKAWVRALPQFTHLRSLYFYSTCTPPLLEAICTLTQLDPEILWQHAEGPGPGVAAARLAPPEHRPSHQNPHAGALDPLAATGAAGIARPACC